MSVDQKQYDRQIRLWGLAAQQRMSETRVLVFGLRGLATEICKNLVLAGNVLMLPVSVKKFLKRSSFYNSRCQFMSMFTKHCILGYDSVTSSQFAGIGDLTIIDDSIVSSEDLGCQFFIRPDDVDKRSRASASIENLQALNPLAKVHAETGSASTLTEDRLHHAMFPCACFCNHLCSRINLLCFQDPRFRCNMCYRYDSFASAPY